MKAYRRGEKLPQMMQVVAAVVGAAAASDVIVPAKRPEGLDVHAALNSYESRPDEPEGWREDPSQLDITGANGRRLIARWTPEGLWIGGCLITQDSVATRLADFITREAEE